MPRWKCNACGGTYSDSLPGGGTYAHACGPLPPDPQGVEHPRINARNENVKREAEGFTHEIIAEGAGVSPLDGQVESEPLWITAMKPKP